MFKTTLLSFLCLLLILGGMTNATAQDDAPAASHELGVNATFFIQQFLSFGDTPLTNPDPYAVTYRRVTPGGKQIIRAGLGIFGRHDKNYEDGENLDARAALWNLDIRLGIERQFNLSKRWSVSVGGDYRGGYESSFTVNNVPQANDNARLRDEIYSNGVAAALGARFHITERVGLYTESALLANFSTFKSTFSFLDNEPEKAKITSFNTRISLPTSLFFIVKF